MQPRKSKVIKPHHDTWVSLLRAELAPKPKPAGGKTRDEIAEMLKSQGLPHGSCYIHRFIRKAVHEGKLKPVNSSELIGGIARRRVYYVPAA